MYEKPLKKQEEAEEEESVYEEKTRDDLVEDDEITPEEDGFMDGYAGQGVGDPAKAKTEDISSSEVKTLKGPRLPASKKLKP